MFLVKIEYKHYFNIKVTISYYIDFLIKIEMNYYSININYINIL